ncbi:hypothetical protein [Streptomyces sp. NK15101]|uniref:hypothetical protein n=1 Tax=Streptomyces sp. NK15101 TaxID=2873261 RepID=UPI001CECE180|nr:hypothetical protein [Streptomyces sp. NK15101]
MRRVGRWIDKHLWTLPFFAFLLTGASLVAIHYFYAKEFFLAAVETENRKEIYSSLTGSSSGLLGFALAAVAIMAAFGRRPTSSQEDRSRENRLADARVGISKILLATSIFLMAILVTATVGIGIDDGKVGSFPITTIIVASSASSLMGLLVSGAGLTLSLMERSRST